MHGLRSFTHEMFINLKVLLKQFRICTLLKGIAASPQLRSESITSELPAHFPSRTCDAAVNVSPCVFSFTWSTSRVDRNTITVMTGQVVEFFDNDFRELYATTESMDLYKEFHITKPPKPMPVRYASSLRTTTGAYTSRFQVSLGDSRQANFKIPAHKYHNPKYLLVVGNSAAGMGSLPDLANRRSSLGGESAFNVMERFLQSSGGSEKPDELTPLPTSIAAPAEPQWKDGKRLNGPSVKKRSSFRLFLKGKGAHQTVPEEGETSPTPSNISPTRKTLDDSFEIVGKPDKPSTPKMKSKKKVQQRSVSLQAVNLDAESTCLCYTIACVSEIPTATVAINVLILFFLFVSLRHKRSAEETEEDLYSVLR